MHVPATACHYYNLFRKNKKKKKTIVKILNSSEYCVQYTQQYTEKII